MACFALAAYQIICGIALVYERQKEIQENLKRELSQKEEEEEKKDQEDVKEELKVSAEPEIEAPVDISEHKEVNKLEDHNEEPPNEPSSEHENLLIQEQVEEVKKENLEVKRGEIEPPADSPVPTVDLSKFDLNKH